MGFNSGFKGLRSKNLQDEDKVRDPNVHRKIILKYTRQLGYEMWTGKNVAYEIVAERRENG